jgi:CopG family nickel-responsive transcriptional regulator
MKGLERIGVSLETDLLAEFDALIARKGYGSRSEAIRDLIRQELSQARLHDPKAHAVAAVVLVYDHHVTKLADKLLSLQHTHLLETVSSMHVHLDHHHCLEVIVLRGPVGQIHHVGDQMVSLKGVRLGRVNVVSTENGHTG